MSATNTGALEQRDQFLRTFDQTHQRVLKGDNVRFDAELGKALQAYKDGIPFQVTWLTPETFGQFLSMETREPGLFNQLASETSFWTLLDQIESACFLQPETLAIARPFIGGLYEGEVSTEKHFTPPANFGYLPVAEAVASYQALVRNIFGSKTTLKAETFLKLATQAKAAEGTEGIPTWLKLSTLARLFEIKGDPLATTDEGRETYAAIVDRFIPEVGKAYRRIFSKHGFNNWRQGQLSAKHVVLTPAGIVSWQKLQETTDDDFCFAPAGADTGKSYSGHSVRLSRLKIVLAEKQFPQDCIMTGGTIATQPDRMSKFEHLGTDCPANAYAPGADGQFGDSLCWYWSGGGLGFDDNWAGHADHGFGSASGRLS
jgi:hypothetical protein